MNQTLPRPSADHSRIAFIQASWHADIVGRGRESFLAEMEKLGFPRDGIDVYTVPGAYEIPLHAKRLATSGRYRGIVACCIERVAFATGYRSMSSFRGNVWQPPT